MEFWIARDLNGSLWIYSHKPIKDGKLFNSNFKLEGIGSFELNEKFFPEVTFENSPKRVELKLIEDEPHSI